MIGMAGGRIWLATAAVDGRKGFDTQCGIVRQALGHNPLSGDMFVFRNRSMARVKILFWDGNGLVLYAKREKGMPDTMTATVLTKSGVVIKCTAFGFGHLNASRKLGVQRHYITSKGEP
jgi:hypothetical protein